MMLPGKQRCSHIKDDGKNCQHFAGVVRGNRVFCRKHDPVPTPGGKAPFKLLILDPLTGSLLYKLRWRISKDGRPTNEQLLTRLTDKPPWGLLVYNAAIKDAFGQVVAEYKTSSKQGLTRPPK